MTKDNTEREYFVRNMEQDETSKVKIPVIKAKSSPKKEIKATVTGIVKGCLLLKDDKENGYRIRITEEYKKYKVGDIIAL